jgi:4-alpha-glucanotransferase
VTHGGDAGTAAPGRSRTKSALHRLGDEVGIIASYLDQTGKERRVTSDATRLAILDAMGIDASSPRAAGDALRTLRAERREELLAPVRVIEADGESLAVIRVQLPSTRGTVTWQLELEDEHGRVRRMEGRADRSRVGLTLGTLPEPGYHTIRLRATAGRRELAAEQSLIVVPPRCTQPSELLGDRKAFGIIANLYTVHSDRNWGIGDLTDLATLAAWSGTIGADFVGVNPLHALLDRGSEISPYSPVSRLFRNVAYIDVESVPELRGDAALDDRIASPELRAELNELRESARVHYEQVMALKMPVLEALHRRFAERDRDGSSPRARAYREFVVSQEPQLTRFATWMALGEARGARGEKLEAYDWRKWPAELQDPNGAAVMQFQKEHAERIDLHRWMQFECDRQLAAAADVARQAGLRIGLYQDLAIGTSPSGSDTWSQPDLFIAGASIGAPPDPYSASGQNWGLPPIDPRGLRRDRYRYFIRLVRSGFRHAGALRIDHVMGLFRLFVIPRGMSGKEGAYIRYPASDLLGILALESRRHRALVVGEDLGTVPKDVPPALEKWGVLSSKVLYFERERRGGFKRAEQYAPLSLATANTHDMATIAGFWRGRDLELRAEVGLIEDERALHEAREMRSQEKVALARRLRQAGVLTGRKRPPRDGETSAEWDVELRGAVHAFLCSSPAVLVGLALDDITGEVEAVNLPGVGPERFPSWMRRMRMSLEEIQRSEEVESVANCSGRGSRVEGRA